MTIIAGGVFENFNVFATDAILPVKDNFNSYKECRMGLKIFPLSNDSFFSVVGNGDVIGAIETLSLWAEIKSLKLNFKDFNHINFCFEAVKKYRESAEKYFKKEKIEIVSSQNVTLYIIDRENIIYWRGLYDSNKKIIKLEKNQYNEIKQNTIHVNCGGKKIINKKDTMTIDQSYNKITNILKEANSKYSSPYSRNPGGLRNRFCYVAIPKNSKNKIIKKYPFENYTDIWAGLFCNWDLLKSSEYIWSPF